MYELPKKLKGFTPYKTLDGDYDIRLDANESFIKLPTEKMVRAVMDIKKIQLNRYPDPQASNVIEAFGNLFGVDSKCVVAGNGSDEIIGIIMAGLLEKGDKVLTLTPDFSMYSFYAKLYELELFELDKGETLEIDVEEVIKYINDKGINCLIFSNPCNPTSLGLLRDDVLKLVNETNALVIVDEAYMDFWGERNSVLDEVSVFKNLIVLRTCSKSFALAGMRLGFAVSNISIAAAIDAIKSPFNVNSITQEIGAAILSDHEGYTMAINTLKKHTDILKQSFIGLQKLGVFDEVFDTKTNFVFAKTKDSKRIYEFLLENKIAIRCFGDYLRVCAGTRDEMNALCIKIAEWKSTDVIGAGLV